MDLTHGWESEGVVEREIQQDGVKAPLIDLYEPVRKSFGMRNLEFFDAPLGEQILRQACINVVVFDQKDANHLCALSFQETMQSKIMSCVQLNLTHCYVVHYSQGLLDEK